MERLSGSMSALDKIKKLTEQLKSLDEEAIKKFKKDFEEFEKEYETMWLSPEKVSDVSIKLSEQKLYQLNEDGEWKECKDGKISLRKLTNKVRKAEGRFLISEPIETSIDHLPIDRIVKKITEKAVSKAQEGMNYTIIDFSIYHGDISDRQEYELLNVLYSKLSEVFTDTLELCISWAYDYDMEGSYMVVGIEW